MAERLLNNWPLKLLSLVVAVILWFYVLGEADPATTQAVTVPVVPVNEPEGLVTISLRPETVELRLRGRASALEQAQTERIRMEANLRHATVGENSVPMRPVGVSVRLTVLPGYPRTATAVLDKVIERQRPVRYEVQGDPASGFVIDQITISPEEVTVRGPTSRVREVARAVVVVDVSGLNTTWSFEAKVEGRNNRNLPVPGVSFTPQNVSVEVIVRQVNVKTVPVRPVVGSPPPGYQVVRVSTEPSVVTVTGDDQLGDLRSVSTIPLDISGLRGTKSYSAALNVPSGLSVQGPAAVQVTVTTEAIGGSSSATTPPGHQTDSDQPDQEDTAPGPGNQDGQPPANDSPSGDGGQNDGVGAGENPHAEGRDNSTPGPEPDGPGT